MAQRDAVTIRFPAGFLTKAREVRAERESLNHLVLEAVDREIRRRQGLAAHATIVQIREQVRARTGPQSDSNALIRELREGRARGG